MTITEVIKQQVHQTEAINEQLSQFSKSHITVLGDKIIWKVGYAFPKYEVKRVITLSLVDKNEWLVSSGFSTRDDIDTEWSDMTENSCYSKMIPFNALNFVEQVSQFVYDSLSGVLLNKDEWVN